VGKKIMEKCIAAKNNGFAWDNLWILQFFNNKSFIYTLFS
jgi:hypothetical protein